MYTAQVDFPFEGDDEQGSALEVCCVILGTWEKHGQIVGDYWPMIELEGAYRFWVTVPEKGALDPKHDSFYMAAHLEWLAREGGGKPSVEVIGEDTGGQYVCEEVAPTALLLFTESGYVESSVRCLDSLAPVPAYRLIEKSEQAFDLWERVSSWAKDFQALDGLQSRTAVGERFAERQLYELDSPLNRRGRSLAQAIEAEYGIPTYYRLFKVRGKSKKAERARKCPSCGGDWLLKEPLHDRLDFRCDPCRLISNIAYTGLN